MGLRIKGDGTEGSLRTAVLRKPNGLYAYSTSLAVAPNKQILAHPDADSNSGLKAYNTTLCGFAAASGNVSAAATTLVSPRHTEIKSRRNHAQLRDIMRSRVWGLSDRSDKDISKSIRKKKKMSDGNKKILKALEFLDNNTRHIIKSRYSDEGGAPDFRQALPKSMEEYLLREHYMSWEEHAADLPDYLITKKGRDKMNELKSINTNENTEFWVKVASIIAILAFLKSFGILDAILKAITKS